MADYPSALTSFPTIVDLVDAVLALHQNERADEIVAVQTTLGTNPQGNAASLKARLAHSIDDDGYLNFDTATELTIASDAITITQNSHKLQPQSGTADDLSTISGTVDGDCGVLYTSDFGTDTITIKHNVGNILCAGGSDITLSYGCVFWYSNGAKVFVSGGGGGSAGGVNKNALSNPGMQVQQRGAGPFTSVTLFPNNDAVYLVDGVVLLSDGNDAADISVVEDNDFKSGYGLQADIETANKRIGFMFPIEKRDIQDIRHTGKASLQFKTKVTGTSISNCRAYLLAWNGPADTITLDPISAWGAAGSDPTFVANWTAENVASNLAVSTTIATHQIQNITVDTASVANLAVLIIIDDTDATLGDFFKVGDVKLEAGTSCTSFVTPVYQEALANCRRHFEAMTMVTGQNNVAGLADSTSAMIGFYAYKVAKRIAAHTYTYSALSDFTIRYTGGAVTVVTASAIASNGLESATLTFTATATPLTAGQAVQLRAANGNAVLYFSSELKA